MNSCTIFVQSDAPEPEILILREKDVLHIGRRASSNGGRSLTLTQSGVSGEHAEIKHTSQGWVITDLGSKNGTTVRGERLKASEPFVLHTGDSVDIAGQELLVFTVLPVVKTARERLGANQVKAMTQTDVTVMVAEITGTGSLASAKADISDPVLAQRIALYVFLNQEMRKSFGHLDQLEGNTIVAWWNRGIPYGALGITKQSGVYRACQTALNLKRFAESMVSRLDVYRDFALNISIATGQAAGGHYGEVLYDDPRQLMFHIDRSGEEETDATTGDIVVDQLTYSMIEDDFRLAEIPNAKLDGQVQPESVYKLLRIRSKHTQATNFTRGEF